ncbi:arylsulfatase A-like [Lytechinus pictus]|uniref:arylsulfatase A-like n=1 Tax=Lytechinus pictus TaxID=7653 RepID=UPI0030B9D393
MNSLLLEISVFLCTFVACQGVDKASLPNIVILFADDLGYGDLEVYGHPTSSTPNLNKLAEGGLVFTQFYAGAPVCSPSRAALLTGRYAVRSGIYPGVLYPVSTGGLPHDETTIAEIVKTKGYSTSIIGKWHLGVGEDGTYLPTNQGFDEYLGVPYSHDMCPCYNCFYPNDPCWNTCNLNFTYCPLFLNSDILEQPVDLTTLDAKYVQQAKTVIKRNTRAGTPFFLYYAFHHTHTPQFASKTFRNATARGTYGDSLAELDWCVGQVMEQLKLSGVLDNTLVLFTSDNGPSLQNENRGGDAGLLKCGKGTTYEGGQRVPAIAYWPQHIAPGRTTALASNLDFLPTIGNLVGANLPNSVTLDGVDMAPILFEGKKGTRDTFFYYYFYPYRKFGIYAVRYNQYKAHYYTQGAPQSNNNNHDKDCRPSRYPTKHSPPLLYDLNVDPGEKYSLPPSEYRDILVKIKEIKKQFEGTMIWGDSQVNKTPSQDVEPCCKRDCIPFPECCQCHRRSWSSSFLSTHGNRDEAKLRWTMD